MPSPVITVENLSKRYLVGHRVKRERDANLRDILGREIRNAARKTADLIRGRQIVQGDTVEEFWALKDVSFEVREGDVLGIIGRNGAGKSTLLKILSRIIEPTSGRVTISGRVASLLEVGTGFHPELSGRENIYLNGAILGMSRSEIRRRFDEIVDFAGVEKFLDTPVKRYSSGMYVRLAFAVAAHLEPEILIVDEVLAVGDIEFQKKCLGKMDEVSRREGRTVLFVSHNMGAVRGLCSRVIYLHDSRLLADGDVGTVVDSYVSRELESVTNKVAGISLGEAITLERFELSAPSIVSGDSLSFEIWLSSATPARIAELAVHVYSSGVRVALLDLRIPEGSYTFSKQGQLRVRGEIRRPPFVEGVYSFGLWVKGPDFAGDTFDLVKLSVKARQHSSVQPYPARTRGFIELDYIFGRVGDNESNPQTAPAIATCEI